MFAGLRFSKFADQPSAVEFAVAEIAHHRREPAAPKQAARVAHGIFAMHTRPVGQRRAGNDDRAEKLGPLAATIITAQPAWQLPMTAGLPSASGCSAITRSRKMASARDDVFDGLPGNGLGQEADEVARMPCLEDDADFALRLEPADARAMPGARIDDDERSLALIDFDAGRRQDAHEHVVNRTRQLAPVHDEFAAEFQNMGREFGGVFLVAFASLLHHVQKQKASLESVNAVRPRIGQKVDRP